MLLRFFLLIFFLGILLLLCSSFWLLVYSYFRFIDTLFTFRGFILFLLLCCCWFVRTDLFHLMFCIYFAQIIRCSFGYSGYRFISFGCAAPPNSAHTHTYNQYVWYLGQDHPDLLIRKHEIKFALRCNRMTILSAYTYICVFPRLSSA